MEQNFQQNYADAVKAIKSAIIQSRYQAARSVNREALSLYYYVGKYISEHSRNNWGTGAIESISDQLQQELPGLRGFSGGNMRKMRIFYEAWQLTFELCASISHKIEVVPLQFENQELVIRALATHNLTKDELQSFLSVPFTHHYEIIKKTSSLQERLFYIELAAKEFWSVEKLQYFLKEKLFEKQATMSNNFRSGCRHLPSSQRTANRLL